MPTGSFRSALARCAGVAVAFAASAGVPCAQAASLPEIRLSSTNAVPACVTPARLMAFLKRRNDHLDPRFRDIASYYKRHGEAWGVRWDYAFFQMAIETNFLTYRAPSGRMGDVDPKQNNFAGIGTTGGGVPGDSFPDVSTGVLGQIQHLVVYSGEEIANPVAPRTQLKQEHILERSRELNRPVRYSDLARRWAADPKYGGSIEWVAQRFRSEACKGGGSAKQQTAAAPAPKQQLADAGSSPVRTLWSRDKAPVPKKEPAKSATAPAKPDSVKPAPQAVPPAQAVEASPTPEAARSEGDDAQLAFFTPPAGLAGVVIPSATREVADPAPAAPGGHAKQAAGAAQAPSPAAPAATKSEDGARETAQPADPAVAPVAVAGSSVGGFMMGKPSPSLSPSFSGRSDFQPPSGLGVKPGRCVIESARYGGETTVLVKAREGEDVHYVALSVLDGFEENMTANFLASRKDGGEVLGTFPSREEALARARGLCPE
ncbi:MAG: hypothetical protein AB7S70_12130 [Hyphomicrobium sp.]|uniref:glucosaminidase domain-containing protein n=1 Tax=Hyphomicrobium sp. TaxID=82 RepID=UPI003D131DCF